MSSDQRRYVTLLAPQLSSTAVPLHLSIFGSHGPSLLKQRIGRNALRCFVDFQKYENQLRLLNPGRQFQLETFTLTLCCAVRGANILPERNRPVLEFGALV